MLNKRIQLKLLRRIPGKDKNHKILNVCNHKNCMINHIIKNSQKDMD